MSRVVVFGLDHKSVGEFRATVNRGYPLYGNPGVSGEMSTQVVISEEIVRKDWMQFGQVVLIEDPYLEPWMGVIDPPWKATLPVTITIYSAEYLFALRTPDTPRLVEGSAATILSEMLLEANSQEEMFVRLGDTSGSDGTVRQETITQKKLWEQMRAFCERTNTELILRPVREDDHLYLYLDISNQMGVDTGELLHDGEKANLVITDAKVVGSLTNRVIGIGSQNTSASRLSAGPFLDDEARDLYRLRSEVVQFRDVVEDTTIAKNAQRSLEYSAAPRLQITGNVLLNDVNLARALRRGNTFKVHASKVYLPGNVQGWRGQMRVTKYFYAETTNTANVTMESFL